MVTGFDDTEPRVHGGAVAAALDFSVNTNPYGPCAAVVEAVRAAAFDRYPDPDAAALKRALAERDGCEAEQVVVGNGAADLLWTLARTLIGKDTSTLVVEPTFCEFTAAAARQPGRLSCWRAEARRDFAVDLAEVAAAVRAAAASVVYLCTPNSPTGYYVPVASVGELAVGFPGTTFVLDEAFLSLSPHHADASVPLPENVVRVRSLTKEHSVPGLRLGHLITTPALARRLEANRPFWTVNSLAQAAGLAAVGEVAFVAASRERILADKAAMVRALTSAGRAPVPSAAPYVLLPVGHGAEAQAKLLRHGILVRDCASYGLPGFIRLAARPAADVERLVQALAEEGL